MIGYKFYTNKCIPCIERHKFPDSRLTLDLQKFKDLRIKDKDFDFVFDKVLDRCKYLGIID